MQMRQPLLAVRPTPYVVLGKVVDASKAVRAMVVAEKIHKAKFDSAFLESTVARRVASLAAVCAGCLACVQAGFPHENQKALCLERSWIWLRMH